MSSQATDDSRGAKKEYWIACNGVLRILWAWELEVSETEGACLLYDEQRYGPSRLTGEAASFQWGEFSTLEDDRIPTSCDWGDDWRD